MIKAQKYFFLLCLVVIAFSACKNQTTIRVGMMGCYALSGDEKEAVVSKKFLQLYDSMLRVKETQSYINKLTTDKSSKLFFSFMLADLPDQIITKLKADSSFTIIEENTIDANETQYHFYKIKKDNNLLVKVLYQQPSLTNSIMIDVVFDDKESWEDFYKNGDAFIKKFNCKNEKN